MFVFGHLKLGGASSSIFKVGTLRENASRWPVGWALWNFKKCSYECRPLIVTIWLVYVIAKRLSKMNIVLKFLIVSNDPDVDGLRENLHDFTWLRRTLGGAVFCDKAEKKDCQKDLVNQRSWTNHKCFKLFTCHLIRVLASTGLGMRYSGIKRTKWNFTVHDMLCLV